MLRLMVRALRRGPRPDALYLDNGSTYSGDTLATACPRLGMRLLHAQPYDPQARGKMERFWRTLRQGCLDYVGELSSLHDVRARVHAFVEQHYHCAPHASLMGRSPGQVWATHTRHELCLDENTLEKALTVRARRRIRGDGTLSIGGLEWEAAQSFIAGTTVRSRAPCSKLRALPGSSTRTGDTPCDPWTPSTTVARVAANLIARHAASTCPSTPPASCSPSPSDAPRWS